MTKARTNADNASADIQGVTAGTGLSGGGTSGTVTLTNDMATTIAAKGDLLAGTANDAYAALTVGANDTVLTADSSTATGLKWATPSAAAFVGCSLYNTTTTSIPNATYTLFTLNTEDFDTDAFHSTVTNTSRITIPTGKGGKYQVNWFLRTDSNATGVKEIEFRKNGSGYKYFSQGGQGTGVSPTAGFSIILNLVAGDYLEIAGYQNTGSTQTWELTQFNGNFSVSYLGA